MSETNTPPASRFVTWFSLAVFNTIALVGLNSELEQDLSDEPKEIKWCISAMIVVLCLSLLGVLAHMLRGKFIGTTMEGGLAFLCLGMWAAVLPAMMKPTNSIAQTRGGGIENANLYFFSWAAFMMALMILVNFARDVHGVGKGKNPNFQTFGWAGLMAASLVTMSAASRLHKSYGCDEEGIEDTDFCSRVNFGVALGLVSGVVAAIWMVCGAKLPGIVDTVLGWAMLAAWVFGVGYITFGDEDKAPARTIGNLYFATWASFIFSTILASSGVRSLFSRGDAAETTTEEAKPEMAADEENAAAEEEIDVAEDAAAEDDAAKEGQAV